MTHSCRILPADCLRVGRELCNATVGERRMDVRYMLVQEHIQGQSKTILLDLKVYTNKRPLACNVTMKDFW